MGRPPTTVLLPTTTWTTACQEVADQLGPDDELLVVCDDESDRVADRDGLPAGVEVVVAGVPDGCSGKANAIDVGMERARHDRIVWTDDDFHHPDDWLATLNADYETHGPVSEVPFFVGRDPLSILLEPGYAFGGTFSVWAGDVVWGGSVIFERSDLDVDAFREELRQTISDDGLLLEYIDVTTLRRARRVEMGGSVRETLERHVRFMKLVRYHDPPAAVINIVLLLVLTAFSIRFPLGTGAVLTATHGAIYLAFGQRRWTALLAYPSVLAMVPLMAYAYARRTFVWGGRRYRWHSKFDVEIVD
ncbi:glycosyltransferase [Halogeometricum borinquense]|uniref:glycosyltransferase n=1 Tax=Halogeometricum borinquense TaxID=60847 RepID=UPI00343007F9